MKQYNTWSQSELLEEKKCLSSVLDTFKAKGISLNMARGKPSGDQLDLSLPLLDVLNSSSNLTAEDGVDCRNYGELIGIAEAKKLFSAYMGVAANEIIVMGSSSLCIMYDFVMRAMLTGVYGSEKPWGKEEKIKFLCPVPGYDRHFSICEFLGIEMINIPMSAEGPDMDMIEKLVASDPLIKGMWCIPKYSNPSGIVFSDKVIRRMAALKPAAKDFRVFCDNAYAVHFIYKDVPMLNLLDAFKEAGNPHMLYLFGSTSKITFPGAGIAFFAASKENVAFIEKQIFVQAICWDKLNMLRHVRYLKDTDNIHAIMQKHAEKLRPKFDAVLDKLESDLSGTGAGQWIKPDGGYFITFIAEAGCAKRIVALCKNAGVVLTDAGATHPYGKDPEDRYIRIAPSFPPLSELVTAMEIFCAAAKLATVERALG